MTAAEQRLGFGLMGVVLLGGAFLGFDYLKNWKQKVDVRSMTLETQRAEAEMLLAEREFWEQRSQWLEQKQPLFTKRSEADLSLLNLIIQQPSAFISIPALTLTPNEQDASEVVLNMTIQKWFRLPAA